MRWAVVIVAVAGCGRVGFDATELGGDGGPPGDGPPPPVLGCSETETAGGSAIAARALEAVVGDRGLAALWLDAASGALFGTTWKATADGVAVVEDGVALAPGPFDALWVAVNGDTLAVVTRAGTEVIARFLHGDLTTALPEVSLGSEAFGRDPITRARGGEGFVVLTLAGEDPAVVPIEDGKLPNQIRLLTDLRFHGAHSIAADSDGYVVVTELADQFGPGCWISKLSDQLAPVSGPGTLESTQQADCDSSAVTASAGPLGAGMAWMDRDPVNSYVEFRGTAGGGGVASMTGETGVALPLVTATSTGFAVAYRSSAGLRVLDGAGLRTLEPGAGPADLVTWSDRAIVVWLTANGAPQLTRLCP